MIYCMASKRGIGFREGTKDKQTKETESKMSKAKSQTNVNCEADDVFYEICPHCDEECEFNLLPNQMIATCLHCGKSIVVCDKCCTLRPDVSDRPCATCTLCVVASFMNYLKGKETEQDFLESLNPPLTDTTIGLPEGAEPTLSDYLHDTYGEQVTWDVKYWDIVRMVAECPLDKESSAAECLSFVQRVIDKNNE